MAFETHARRHAKALLDELKSYGAGPAPERQVNDRLKAAELLVPIHVRKGDLELRLFCTYMSLGTPQDVTLQELRIETLFPADESSERIWKSVTGNRETVMFRGNPQIERSTG